MELYTIGFTQKSARQFFGLITKHGIRHLLDIRINPSGQLSGFARREDLPYFLQELAGGCQYSYLPILAPTKDLLNDFRENKDWEQYVGRFEALMDERNIPAALDRSLFENGPSCLLCSEAKPEHCHRRLVAERLGRSWPDVEIIHLT